jgi:hypothetical protein
MLNRIVLLVSALALLLGMAPEAKSYSADRFDVNLALQPPRLPRISISSDFERSPLINRAEAKCLGSAFSTGLYPHSLKRCLIRPALSS